MVGLTELIIILVVAGILFFGGKKLGELGKSMGRFTGEFKKGKREIDEELKQTKKDIDETTGSQ